MTCTSYSKRQRGGSNCSGGDVVQDGGVQGFQFGGKRRRTKKGKKTYKRRNTKGKGKGKSKKTRRH
mgnify:CR=1 FL=1